MHFLICSTGHGWREIEDEWDFPRVEGWISYCGKHPPLQAMVQAYLGFDAKEPMRVTEANFGEFVAMLSMESKVGGNA